MAKTQRKRNKNAGSSSSKYDTGTSATDFAGTVVLGIPMTFWLAGVVLAVAAYFVGRLSSSNFVDAYSAYGQGIEKVTRSANSASLKQDPLATQLFDEATSLKASLELDAWELINQHVATRRLQKKPQHQEGDGSAISTDQQNDHQAEEANLRLAMAKAPWLPAAHIILANHVSEHGDQRSRVFEWFQLLRQGMRLHHAIPAAEKGKTAEGLLSSLEKYPSFSRPFDGTTHPSKLRHDRDQLIALGERGRLPLDLVNRYVQAYDQLLEQIAPHQWAKTIGIPVETWANTVGNIWNRALYVPELPALQEQGVLNPALDFPALETAYRSSNPHVLVVDNLLTPEALAALQQYYQEATIFWDAYPGYVGAHLFDGGLGNPVVAQLVQELQDKFPRLICSHRLTQAWAFKYDSEIKQPVNPHADMAAINFNLWLDDGNLDNNGTRDGSDKSSSGSGGLVVYKVVPPPGTPFEVFNHNRNPLHPNAHRMLRESDYANYTIAHKANRAVIFQSDLFHQSGEMRSWSPLYSKRRINLTLLFGKMGDTCTE
jgi:hypothetical protein